MLWRASGHLLANCFPPAEATVGAAVFPVPSTHISISRADAVSAAPLGGDARVGDPQQSPPPAKKTKKAKTPTFCFSFLQDVCDERACVAAALHAFRRGVIGTDAG